MNIQNLLTNYANMLSQSHEFYSNYDTIKGSDARPFGDALNMLANVVNDMREKAADAAAAESKRLSDEKKEQQMTKAREQKERNEKLKKKKK